ncbi:MAG: TIGR03790 family protein [Verrucomicrobiota bacterium]
MRFCFPFLLLLLLLLAVDLHAERSLTESTIVVFNKTAPESVKLANFYAQQRGIPRDHLVGLNCSSEEEISRAEYDDNIANPLREAFKDHKWWTVHELARGTSTKENPIRFVAVIRGVPLKIRSAGDYPGDVPGPGPLGNRNEASVDSELTMLSATARQISGFAMNPYFKSFRAIEDFDNIGMLLVCRLDAPDASTVRRMIVDSIAAEKNGLWGRAYVDGAHNTSQGLAVGDQWLTEILQQLHKNGIPTVYDDAPEIFPEAYPITDCALYYGWYAAAVAGPFARPDFRFLPGAIAVHIHSFSASTLRDPNADWVGPLVSHGAAASLGNVYEPYLQLTAQLDVFNDRLLHGFTFAESAYMSMRALSWMSVMVGDPLYRPYLSWLQIAQRDSAKAANEWKVYHELAVKDATVPAPVWRTAARQAAMRIRSGPIMEDLGLLETHNGHFAAATNNFQLARTYYTKRDDIVRVVLEESDAWIKMNKPKRALELVRSTMRTAPDTPAAPLLRAIEREASGRPPPPPMPSKP